MSEIKVIDASVNNLRNVSVDIPLNKITCITGISGSGKSSLAFNTIHEHGRSRYSEALSLRTANYYRAKRNPGKYSVINMPPSAGVKQLPETVRGSVSLFSGTDSLISELFADYSDIRCPLCMSEAELYRNREEILEDIFSIYKDKFIYVTSLFKDFQNVENLLKDLMKRGYTRVIKGSEIFNIEDMIKAEDYNIYEPLSLITEALDLEEEDYEDLRGGISRALCEGEQLIAVYTGDLKKCSFYSLKRFCKKCLKTFEPLSSDEFSMNSSGTHCTLCSGRGVYEKNECEKCRGTGLSTGAVQTEYRGRGVADILSMEINDLIIFFESLLSDIKEEREEDLVSQILGILREISEFSLEYISLKRDVKTLSGGEVQRLRIIRTIRYNVNGFAFILDEPSRGLHKDDVEKLCSKVLKLRDGGNTVIIVEHDPEIIRSADYIVDLGPGAGENGGNIVFSGNFDNFASAKNSISSDYLFRLQHKSDLNKSRSLLNSYINIKDISVNNIRNQNLVIPCSSFSVVTGRSGSGKTSLVYGALYNIMKSRLTGEDYKTGLYDVSFSEVSSDISFSAVKKLNKSIYTSPKRGFLAAYLDIMKYVRDFFSKLQDSVVFDMGREHFSFFSEKGWCPECKGRGYSTAHSNRGAEFPSVCRLCKGRLYNNQVLKVKFKGKSIYDVLTLTVGEAKEFFRNIPYVFKRIEAADNLGLSYMRLLHNLSDMSGGEIQRVKIAKELLISGKRGRILYLMDEPSAGLHLYDIIKLVDLIKALVNRGDTVVVSEHNRDIISASDFIVSMGPGSGKSGGKILSCTENKSPI